MTKIIAILINILIVGVFFYSKLLPYKDKLTPEYKKTFDFFNRIFSPILKLLKNVFKPLQVGLGLSVDMTQVVFLIFLLFALNFF
jgi:hypothetical protein